LIQRLIGLFRSTIAERQARAKGFGDLAAELEASGRDLDDRLDGVPDSPANREAIAHWVGIERWGQRRLRVALGEPFVLDEYHGYRPETDVGTEELRRALTDTRRETVDLAHRLNEAGVDPATTVRHNDLGELSLRGWLAYLEQHPRQEAQARLRG